MQTRRPGHTAITFAAQHDVAGFAAAELVERTEVPYPPVVELANVVVSGTKETVVADGAVALAAWLNALFAAKPAARVTLLGPAPCPIEKVRDRFRWHLLLKSDDGARLTRVLGYLAANSPLPGSLRLVIDRDPVSVL